MTIASTGFIGCGRIAEPMVESLVRRFPEMKIYVTERSTTISQRLTGEYQNVLSGDVQWVVDQSDCVVVSVLAEIAKQILPEVRFRKGQQIISVMADITLEEVGNLTAPGNDPCVTIPLPFISSGGCPLPVYPPSPALEALFGDDNILIPVASESHMGPHFAATALLSTIMAELETAANWLGSRTGDRCQAEIYMASLVGGYLGVLPKDGKQRFAEALQDLSTEGGLNTQLLTHNRDNGLLEFLYQGFEDLGQRLDQTQND